MSSCLSGQRPICRMKLSLLQIITILSDPFVLHSIAFDCWLTCRIADQNLFAQTDPLRLTRLQLLPIQVSLPENRGSSCRLGVAPTTNYSPSRHGKPGEGERRGRRAEAALQQLTFVAGGSQTNTTNTNTQIRHGNPGEGEKNNWLLVPVENYPNLSDFSPDNNYQIIIFQSSPWEKERLSSTVDIWKVTKKKDSSQRHDDKKYLQASVFCKLGLPKRERLSSTFDNLEGKKGFLAKTRRQEISASLVCQVLSIHVATKHLKIGRELISRRWQRESILECISRSSLLSLVRLYGHLPLVKDQLSSRRRAPPTSSSPSPSPTSSSPPSPPTSSPSWSPPPLSLIATSSSLSITELSLIVTLVVVPEYIALHLLENLH